ncbi:MAG: hypothetical protein AAFO79_07875, partial [Pseudomonadota bacterium]
GAPTRNAAFKPAMKRSAARAIAALKRTRDELSRPAPLYRNDNRTCHNSLLSFELASLQLTGGQFASLTFDLAPYGTFDKSAVDKAPTAVDLLAR